MSAYEYDDEPIRGLPGELPEGERILWQGGPDWATFAVHALHVRVVTLYFGALVAAQPLIAAANGADRQALAKAAGESVWLAALGLVAVGLLCLFAWLTARTTVYTITNKRVVLRIGIAIQKMVNLPFAVVDSAALRTLPAGAGELSLTMQPSARPSYILLWPHVRPWRWNPPQPLLRALVNARQPAEILAAALQATHAEKANTQLAAAPQKNPAAPVIATPFPTPSSPPVAAAQSSPVSPSPIAVAPATV